MNFYQEIMHRHNECIVQLSDTNLLQSYHVLQDIVTILRSHITDTTSPELPLTSAPAWALHPTSESILKEVEAYGIYDRPLLLVWNASSSSGDEPSMSLLTATVLFNVALVCHWIGTIHGNERSLTVATKLYLVVNEVLQGMVFTFCRPALLLLSLAVHNLGHLQNSQCNYPAYCRCMEAVWHLVPQIMLKDDPFEQHLLCSLRMWQCIGPPNDAAAK
jgi:hypothetical protein